jgi:hypothetical protein
MTMETSPFSSATFGRPVPITVICVLSAIGVLFAIPLLFSEAARSIGAWYPPYLALSAIVGGACAVGFWIMRKWAAYLYIAMFVVNQIVMLAMGIWSVFALVIPLIVVVIACVYLPRMR